MRLFAIGDVHGCARSLDALLAKLALTPEDRVVFVGDYTDRGPDSKGVIDRLVEMEAASEDRTGPRCVFIRGNHDQMMLDYIERGEMELWRVNGGIETLESYAAEGRIPEAHHAFLRRTRLYLDTPDFCFVHAGLKPYYPVAYNLQYETAETFLWTREHLSMPQREWEKPVVCGHTPQPEPVDQPDLLCIDTGCVYHTHLEYGTLTAVQLPERTFVSVEYSG
ncbi:MAG: metallophosphoesterase family protein [Bacteroidota bacterium]